MEQARPNSSDGPRNKPSVAPATPSKSGCVRPAKQQRKPVDGRTRSAKRWRSLRDDLLAQTANRHPEMCATLASISVALESYDHAVASGRLVDVDLMLRLASEARRLRERLGLITGDEEPAQPLVPPDSPSWLVGPRAPAADTAR